MVLEIEPDVHTNWGTWGRRAICAYGHYVTGMQLRIQPYTTRDNTALNAIRMKCSDGQILDSKEGRRGDWLEWKESKDKRKIVKVWVRSEAKQGSRIDDTAANGVGFEDEDGDSYVPGRGIWGDWF